MDHESHLIVLAVLWILYFAIHSALASLTVKQWIADRWPRAMTAYRIVYNVLAVVLLLPPLWLTFTWPGPMLWEWRGPGFYLANALALVALVLFLWSLRFYDGGAFLGISQLRHGSRDVKDQESFTISPLHRYVRHPWYVLGLVLVWTRDMDAARLLGALMITAYFMVGSRLEERKLIVVHGAAYQAFMKRVPGLLPRPWRRMSKRQAEALTANRSEKQ